MTVLAASRSPRPPPDGAGLRNVLVVDDDDGLARGLAAHLSGTRVTWVAAPDDTEGRGVDAVVVAGRFPLHLLRDVRVHPELGDVPVAVALADPSELGKSSDLPGESVTVIGRDPGALVRALGRLTPAAI